jgi:hypothetical protein
VLDPSLRGIGSWGSEGTSRGQFVNPTGVTCDAEGHVYVADLRSHRIQKFRVG